MYKISFIMFNMVLLAGFWPRRVSWLELPLAGDRSFKR